MKELNKLITKEGTGMNRELFKRCFNLHIPTVMLKAVYIFNDRKKINELLNIIKRMIELNDLKNEIERIPEGDIKIEKPYEIVDIVQKIFELEKAKKDRTKNFNTKPNAYRLRFSLAQLNAENNLKILKNEIR